MHRKINGLAIILCHVAHNTIISCCWFFEDFTMQIEKKGTLFINIDEAQRGELAK